MIRIKFYAPVLLSMLLFSCQPEPPVFMTVTGPVPVTKMAKTLEHEHILVDFIGADSTGYSRWNKEEVAKTMLPFLKEVHAMGYNTFMDCTPAYLGRDPLLLKKLAEETGMYIVTNTGLYSAYEGKFIPDSLQKMTAQELADRWINEAKYGIENTGVLPGFIKISVERAPLGELNRKVVEAACITHKETGLVIMSHTGPATPAFQQLEILKLYKVRPSAFIWTHANNEKDYNKILEVARMGAYISFDKFTKNDLDEYVDFILFMKKHGQLPQVLISQDSGWYKPGEPGGGVIRGYTDIENYLIPALEKAGISQFDIYQMLIKNPGEAFGIYKRLLKE